MKWLEKYWPFLAGTSVSIGLYWSLCWPSIVSEEIIEVNITIAAVVFGFLLTMLSIMVQAQNEAVSFLKKHGRFKDVMFLNILPVGMAGIIIVFSVVLLAIAYKFEGFQFHVVVEVVWMSLNASLILSTFNFVNIFYMLISKH